MTSLGSSTALGPRARSLRIAALLAGVAVLGACVPDGPSTGSAEVVGLPISAGDVTAATVTITGPGIDPALQASLANVGGRWSGTIGRIPAGPDRTFVLEAFAAGGGKIFEGRATGVTITAGQTAVVAITAQQVTAPVAFANAAPVIDALTASAASVAPGGTVSLSARAHDADPGQALTVSWQAAGGTFSDPAALITTWTAPATEGSHELRLTVSDPLGAAATLALPVMVQTGAGGGGAGVVVTLNAWPTVMGLSASPTRIDVGQATTLDVSAADPDGDPLTYQWSADCAGTFSSASASNPQFTLATRPASDLCSVSVTVSDGRGGASSGRLTIGAGPGPATNLAPQVTATFQSSATADGGASVTLRLQAQDPEGGPLTFAWTRDTGTLGPPSQTGNSGQVTWTAPACFSGGSATIFAAVADAAGASTSFTFAITTRANTGCASPAPARLVSGGAHSCLLDDSGVPRCWGENASDALRAPAGPFTDLDTDYRHTCAIRSSGAIACWGSSTYGAISAPAGSYTTVATGGDTSCAIRVDGTLSCWGANDFGQASPPAGAFRALTVGFGFACALRADGTAACWGRNQYGQATAPAGTFRTISASKQTSYACGVRPDGTLTCWGNAPANIPSGTFEHLSAGSLHACALRADGSAACWGSGDFYGQISGPAGLFASISAGDTHTCGIRPDGTLACWGSNFYGTRIPPGGTFTRIDYGCRIRSDGTLACWNDQLLSTPPGQFASVSTRGSHACALRADGSAACWGENSHGQATPPAVTFRSISAGGQLSCGVASDESVRCWGRGDSGETAVPTGAFTGVGAGQGFACGLRTDGTLTCWGSPGPTPPGGSHVALAITRFGACAQRPDQTWSCWRGTTAPAEPLTALSPGPSFGCGLRPDGTALCWGVGSFGEERARAGTYSAITVGDSFACALGTDGREACWGRVWR